MQTEIVRSARYMTQFRCLGGDCEDNCCTGWTVPIDKPTHRHLTVLAAGDPAARQLLERGIELTSEGPHFGKLRLDDTGRCSMLDDAGLCEIHTRFGHDALFDVCVTYPRYFSEVDGELELFGTLSCPEVARLCLLRERSLELEQSTQDAPRKLRNQFRTEHPYFEPFLLVRDACVRLLSMLGYSLSEKLFVLLWIANKLSDTVHSKTKAAPRRDVSATLDRLLAPDTVRHLVENYRTLQLDGALAIAVLTSVLDQTATSADAAEQWTVQEALRERLSPSAMERIDVCLTRYCLNHLYTTPYMLFDSVFAQARELIWRAAMLRLQLQRRLAGFEGSAEDLDRNLVEVVYRFARRIEHSNLLGQLARALEWQRLNSLAHTVCFLRV